MIETHPLVPAPLDGAALERALDGQDALEWRPAGGSNALSRAHGLDIEQFMLHRLRAFPTTPKVLGRLRSKNKKEPLGLLTQVPSNMQRIPLNRFHFFEAYSDEDERLRALIRVFLDLFYALHFLHGPQYPQEILRDVAREFRPQRPFHFSNNALSPKNLLILQSQAEQLPRAMIHRFHEAAPAELAARLISQRTAYQPPEDATGKPARISDGCAWDLFAMGIMLFGALSPSGSEFGDYSLGVFASLEALPMDGQAVQVRRFLFDPLEEVFPSLPDAQAFLTTCTWTDPFPADLMEKQKSTFDNLLALSLHGWDNLRPEGTCSELAPILTHCVGETIRAPFCPADETAHAGDLFRHLWVAWSMLHPDQSEPSLIQDAFGELGLPRDFSSADFPYTRLKIPATQTPTHIAWQDLTGGSPLTSLTLDWRCHPMVDARHHITTTLSANLPQPLTFHMLQIGRNGDTPEICFCCEGDLEESVSHDALIEFDDFSHPAILALCFDADQSTVSFEKPLDLAYLESRIAALFPEGRLPLEDQISMVRDVWEQCLEEFDPAFLESDRKGWYHAFAVLSSNLLMMPESVRRTRGLIPLIPEDSSWRTHDLAQHVEHLESEEGLFTFTFDPTFATAACLQLLKLGAAALEQRDFDRLESVLAALERHVQASTSSRNEEIAEHVEYLGSCLELHRLLDESIPPKS